MILELDDPFPMRKDYKILKLINSKFDFFKVLGFPINTDSNIQILVNLNNIKYKNIVLRSSCGGNYYETLEKVLISYTQFGYIHTDKRRDFKGSRKKLFYTLPYVTLEILDNNDYKTLREKIKDFKFKGFSLSIINGDLEKDKHRLNNIAEKIKQTQTKSIPYKSKVIISYFKAESNSKNKADYIINFSFFPQLTTRQINLSFNRKVRLLEHFGFLFINSVFKFIDQFNLAPFIDVNSNNEKNEKDLFREIFLYLNSNHKIEPDFFKNNLSQFLMDKGVCIDDDDHLHYYLEDVGMIKTFFKDFIIQKLNPEK